MRAVSLCAVVLACACLAVPGWAKAPDGHSKGVKPGEGVPREQMLRKLQTAAKPLIVAISDKLDQVRVAEANGRYVRVRQGLVMGVAGSRVVRTKDVDTPYRGYVTVAVDWWSPSTYLFKTEMEAANADLEEMEPGRVRLTFTYEAGKWLYNGMRQE